MKIVINEVQKFSKKDYWRFLKIRFKEDKTIILLYAAVGFYGFSLLFTILLGISPVFGLLLRYISCTAGNTVLVCGLFI